MEVLCACQEVDTSLLTSHGKSSIDLAANDCQLILSTKSNVFVMTYCSQIIPSH